MTVRPALLAVAVVAAALLASCSGSDGPDAAASLTVTSTADECTLSATEAPAGSIAFQVANEGDDTTEFYVLSEDGSDVLGEVENIGPGLSRTLEVELEEGTYTTSCKPGMKGDGITAPFEVVPAP